MLWGNGIVNGIKGAIALLLTLILAQGGRAAAVPKQTWQLLQATPAGFRLEFPGVVEMQEPLVLDLPTGALVLAGAIAHHENAQYVFAFGDYPQGEASVLEHLAVLRDHMIKDTHWTLAEQRSLPFWIYPGQQFTLFSVDEMITYRFYGVGDRIYILGVLQDPRVDLKEEIAAFFGSFGIIR